MDQNSFRDEMLQHLHLLTGLGVMRVCWGCGQVEWNAFFIMNHFLSVSTGNIF